MVWSNLVLVAAFGILSLASPIHGSCDAGYTELAWTLCYKVFMIPMSFEDAIKTCASEGSSLLDPEFIPFFNDPEDFDQLPIGNYRVDAKWDLKRRSWIRDADSNSVHFVDTISPYTLDVIQLHRYSLVWNLKYPEPGSENYMWKAYDEQFPLPFICGTGTSVMPPARSSVTPPNTSSATTVPLENDAMNFS